MIAGEAEERSAGALVGEAVSGIRTVASFNAEHRFYTDYCARVDEMAAQGRRRAFKVGLAKGIGKGSVFYCIAAIQIYGAWLVSEGVLGMREPSAPQI